MTPVSVLLRIVLCACLVLNGSAWALSADHHAASAAREAAAVAAAHENAQAPCHENAHDAAPHHETAAALPEGPDPAHDSPGDPGDCCGEAGCSCDCLHHSSLAVAESLSVAPSIRPSEPAVAFAVKHAAPSLPHLIRPPIG